MSIKINHRSTSPRSILLRKLCATRLETVSRIHELEAIPGMEDAVALMKKAFALQKAARSIAQLAPHAGGRINGQIPNEEEIQNAKQKAYERKQAKREAKGTAAAK